MKSKLKLNPLLAAATLLATLIHPLSTGLAQGTAFSYQGRLNTASGAANGSYDLTFTLFNTNAGGILVSGPVTNSAVSVSNGLFTVAVDFGSAPFKLGQPLWLEIGARTNSAATFSTLAPRQVVLSTPIATYAESANAANLAGTIVSANLPNGLGGSGDSASGLNATVSGGNGNQVDAASSYSTIGAGNANSIANSLYATIGGGNQNVINNTGGFGTIGGGNGNFIANTLDGTIAGGFHNVITNGATFAAVGGGNGNAIGGGFDSVIGGGFQNFVNASFATVPGGANNSAVANYSFAAGDQAQAVNAGAFVWADSQGVNFSSTNNNSFNVRAQGGARFVTSGAGLTVDGLVAATSFAGNGSGLTALNATNLTGTIASANLPNGLGGSGDTASGLNATVSGGSGNQVDAASSYSTIGAGNANSIANSLYATIGGGNQNTINNTGGFGTIGGGNGNAIANTLDGTIAGGFHNAITNGATFAAVGGGNGNVIGGGFDSVIGGGFQNFVNASYATVPGGANNSAVGDYSFAAGRQAKANNQGSFVWADSTGVDFASTANNQFLIRAAGNVGINTTTPTSALQVNGTVTANAFSGPGTGLTGVALIAGGNAFTGNQTVSSGSVGIGTNSPQWPLHVVGAGGGTSGIIAAETTGGSGGPQLRLKVGGPNSQEWVFVANGAINGSVGDFQIVQQVGGSRMVIKTNGNVGIGTTTPSTALEVVGTVTANGFSGSGTGLSGVALLNGNNTFTGNEVINAGGAGVKVAGTAAPSTYFGSLISDGGSGDFWFLSAYSASGSKRNTIYGAGGSTPLVFQEQGGNVGIGTITPTNTLQVIGTVAASALRSPGAGINTGTFAFTQRAVSTNTSGNTTFIYNPLTDGDPNAILIVTHNWTADTNSTSQYNTKSVGVYYTGANWAIFNEDTSAMALGRAFNVMVIKN